MFVCCIRSVSFIAFVCFLRYCSGLLAPLFGFDYLVVIWRPVGC